MRPLPLPRASWLRTWLAAHQLAFASSPCAVPPFPLTPHIITRVAAVFKAGGYMSFDNYMYHAKSVHLGRGLAGPCAWSSEHRKAMQDAIIALGGVPRLLTFIRSGSQVRASHCFCSLYIAIAYTAAQSHLWLSTRPPLLALALTVEP